MFINIVINDLEFFFLKLSQFESNFELKRHCRACCFHPEQSLAYLECKIQEHSQLQKIFPDQWLLPKHNFLEDYIEIMRLFGPICDAFDHAF